MTFTWKTYDIELWVGVLIKIQKKLLTQPNLNDIASWTWLNYLTKFDHEHLKNFFFLNDDFLKKLELVNLEKVHGNAICFSYWEKPWIVIPRS
jgi:hypothetical protein